MATIRRRGEKWQVQFRRKGQRSISCTFSVRKDAEAWARSMEVRADRRQLPQDPRLLDGLVLGDLVKRYRDTIVLRKKGHQYERILLDAFLRHPICAKRLSDLRTEHFAKYRDQRLSTVKPDSLRRQLNTIRHMFEIARHEWEIPIAENPLKKLKLPSASSGRERRLRPGEYERLVEAARQCRNKYVLPIIELALQTAMRRVSVIKSFGNVGRLT